MNECDKVWSLHRAIMFDCNREESDKSELVVDHINNNPLAGTPRGYSSLVTWSPYISKFIYTPEKDTYIGLRAASTVSGSSVIWTHCSNFHILSFPKYIMRLK